MTWSAAVAAALGALATIPPVTPAAAQFYKGKTLTLIVNYGVGGNIDTEARILARHLPKHIAGAPTIIIQNTPGARIEGPAVIEEQTSTIVLYPGQHAGVDDYLNIEVQVQS